AFMPSASPVCIATPDSTAAPFWSPTQLVLALLPAFTPSLYALNSSALTVPSLFLSAAWATLPCQPLKPPTLAPVPTSVPILVSCELVRNFRSGEPARYVSSSARVTLPSLLPDWSAALSSLSCHEPDAQPALASSDEMVAGVVTAEVRWVPSA